jgi:glucose-1-phosphate thymidylyltransferase
MHASQFVQVLEKRQGLKVGCIEEIVYKRGYITKGQLLILANKYANSGYGKYLISLINE